MVFLVYTDHIQNLLLRNKVLIHIMNIDFNERYTSKRGPGVVGGGEVFNFFKLLFGLSSLLFILASCVTSLAIVPRLGSVSLESA